VEDDSSLVLEAAERLRAVELVPVIAHPERSLGLRADFGIARALVEHGCLLCPNGDSALGDNGPVAEQAFWRLVDEGLVALVASDGHSRQRPPRLDRARRTLRKGVDRGAVRRVRDALDLLAQRDQLGGRRSSRSGRPAQEREPPSGSTRGDVASYASERRARSPAAVLDSGLEVREGGHLV